MLHDSGKGKSFRYFKRVDQSVYLRNISILIPRFTRTWNPMQSWTLKCALKLFIYSSVAIIRSKTCSFGVGLFKDSIRLNFDGHSGSKEMGHSSWPSLTSSEGAEIRIDSLYKYRYHLDNNKFDQNSPRFYISPHHIQLQMAINFEEKPVDTEPPEASSTGTLSTEARNSEPEFPEGGTRGWLVILGCFCVMFFTFGYVNAFG